MDRESNCPHVSSDGFRGLVQLCARRNAEASYIDSPLIDDVTISLLYYLCYANNFFMIS